MQIAFYHAWQDRASYVDKLISIFTAGKFSHTETVFDDGMCFGIDGRSGGARFKQIDLDSKRWTLVKIKMSPLSHNTVRIKAERLVELNVQYDYIGAFTCGVFSFCIQKKDKLFCSEASVNLIRTQYPHWYLDKGCKYSPNKLYKELIKES